MIKKMTSFKINPEVCTKCFSTISSGQAVCTTNIFGSPVCVKCLSGYDKYNSAYLKTRNKKLLASEKLELVY